MQIGLGLGGRAETLIGGRRYAGGPAQILGEALGTLKPCGGAARPESLNAGGLQVVHDAGAQRRFRAHDHEVDAIRPAKRNHFAMIRNVEGDALGLMRDAGISRCTEKPVRQRTCRHLPGERMLASAGSEEQNIHWVKRFAAAPVA